MKISKGVTDILDVGGPYVERLAHAAWAYEVGDITKAEREELRDMIMLQWKTHQERSA